MSILVTGPTGNIGSIIAKRLVEAGEDVSVIVRDPDRLDPEVRSKVTIHQGDMFDEEFVAKATEGVDALFWMNPPNFQAPDWRATFEQAARVVSNAVRTNGISHVVLLSSIGAEHETGWGPISYLHVIEKALSETGANVLILRPGYFYENFLAQLDAIRNASSLFYPFPPDTTIPMIATKDIAEVAARRLRAKDFTGVSYLGLHGPAEQPTIRQVAQIIGEAIGKPVQYVVVPLEAVRQQFAAMGASPSVVEGYSELLAALSQGVEPAEPRTPETTTPTTLREWAEATIKPLVG